MDPISFMRNRSGKTKNPINYYEGSTQINAGPDATHVFRLYKQGQDSVTYQRASFSVESIYTEDGSTFQNDLTYIDADANNYNLMGMGYGFGGYGPATPEKYVFSEDDALVSSSKTLVTPYNMIGTGGITYAASPDAKYIAYVAGNDAVFAGYGYGVMSSTDGGNSFKIAASFANPGPNGSTFTGDYWNGIYLFNENDFIKRQYRSNDYGNTWVREFPGEDRCAVAMTNGFAVFSGTGLKSTTNGTTFTLVNAAITAVPTMKTIARKDNRSMIAFVSGSNVVTVTDSYVATTSPTPANKFFMSIAWDQNNSRFVALACDTTGSNNIYNNAELYESTDDCATWTLVTLLTDANQINRRTLRSMINGYFVISGNGPTSFSTDLINWTVATNSQVFSQGFNSIRLSSNFEIGDQLSSTRTLYVNEFRPAAIGSISEPFQQKYVSYFGSYQYTSGQTAPANPLTITDIRTGTSIANTATVAGSAASLQTLLNNETWYNGSYTNNGIQTRLYSTAGKLMFPMIASSVSGQQRRSMNAYLRKFSTDASEAVWSEEFNTKGKIKTVILPSVQSSDEGENRWTLMANYGDANGVMWSMPETQAVAANPNNNPVFSFTSTQPGVVSALTFFASGITTAPTSITIEEPCIQGAAANTLPTSTLGMYGYVANSLPSNPKAFYCQNHNLIDGMRVTHTQTPAGSGMTMFNGSSNVNYGDRDYYVKVINSNYFELYFEAARTSLFNTVSMGTATTQKLTFPDHGVTAKAKPYINGNMLYATITEPGAMYRKLPTITVTGGNGTISSKTPVVDIYKCKVSAISIIKEGLIEDSTPAGTDTRYAVAFSTPNTTTNQLTGVKNVGANNVAFHGFMTPFETSDYYMTTGNQYPVSVIDWASMNLYAPYETESLTYLTRIGFYNNTYGSTGSFGWSNMSQYIYYSTDGLKSFARYRINGSNVPNFYNYIGGFGLGGIEIYPASIPATTPIVQAIIGVKIFQNKAFVFGIEGYGLKNSSGGFFSRPMIRVINHSNGILSADTSASAMSSVVTHIDTALTNSYDYANIRPIVSVQGNALSTQTPTKYFALSTNQFGGVDSTTTLISSADGLTWVTDTSIDSTKGTVDCVTYNTGLEKWVVTFRSTLNFGISTDKMGTAWTYYNDPTDVILP